MLEGEAGGDESDSADEAETGIGPGTVFRLSRGQLERLAGGMDEYEEIAARTAGRAGRATG
jgi:ATP-binding cassette subfamily F protein 3